MKRISENEPDPREVYGDIIAHPHWESPVHPPMSRHDRAAQFAPFAALTGYGDMIDEEERQVGRRIELGEDETAAVNEVLVRIRRALDAGERPAVTVTYFVPDPLKDGGRYETTAETVRRFDPVNGRLIPERKAGPAGSDAGIRISDILEIHYGEPSPP